MSSASGSAPEATVGAYEVTEVLPGVESIPDGTNLLVRGPPMVGRRDLALDLLAAGGGDEHAVLVSTDRSASRLLDAYHRRGGGAEAYAVDCSGRGRGGDDRIRDVASPGDLTGIGIGVVKCTRGLDEGRGLAGVRIGTLSVSTILQYVATDRVFNFLHVLTGRFEGAGYLGVFTLDPSAHDERTVNSLRSLFDGEVAIRETETGRQVRMRGLDGAPRGWVDWEW